MNVVVQRSKGDLWAEEREEEEGGGWGGSMSWHDSLPLFPPPTWNHQDLHAFCPGDGKAVWK